MKILRLRARLWWQWLRDMHPYRLTVKRHTPPPGSAWRSYVSWVGVVAGRRFEVGSIQQWTEDEARDFVRREYQRITFGERAEPRPSAPPPSAPPRAHSPTIYPAPAMWEGQPVPPGGQQIGCICGWRGMPTMDGHAFVAGCLHCDTRMAEYREHERAATEFPDAHEIAEYMRRADRD